MGQIVDCCAFGGVIDVMMHFFGAYVDVNWLEINVVWCLPLFCTRFKEVWLDFWQFSSKISENTFWGGEFAFDIFNHNIPVITLKLPVFTGFISSQDLALEFQSKSNKNLKYALYTKPPIPFLLVIFFSYL